MVLGNCIGCGGGGTTQYTLTTTSTDGGNVTTPGESTYTYNASQVVNLVATPDSGYRFVNWTGNVGTIANVTAASTTITMNGNYTISANFALGVLIANVPDTNQPPTNLLPPPHLITNYCAPMAMVNILGYWDVVKGLLNAKNVTAFQQPYNLNTVAEYLGYFMDTNNAGSPARANGGQLGTKDIDIAPGTLEFVRWDLANPFLTPPPVLPAGKLGYNWSVLTNCDTSYNNTLALYKHEIDSGRPLVVSFDYWNPVFGTNVTDPQSGETISVFGWGTPTSSSHFPDPEEYWITSDIGHAVTGVGYVLNWDPDGAGGLPQTDYVIVHDNWATTPENVAIPWANWMCLFPVSP